MWRKLAFFMVMGCALPLAHAEFYGFNCITNNIASDCTIGQTQLAVEVTDPGGGQVRFRFFNIGPAASSITDIYFDDGTLLGIATVTDGAGVDFEIDASPGNLPGGGGITPAFVASGPAFTADSEPPAQPNGVNPGEEVTLLVNLILGKTFNDTLDALTLGLTDGGNAQALRIGIHVQGFASGGSEGFVNGPPLTPGDPRRPPEAVPEPTSVALLGSALLGVCHLLRKRFAA